MPRKLTDPFVDAAQGVVRISSFFFKEIWASIRQPKLVLSVLLGPFLILAAFGIGYKGQTPVHRAALADLIARVSVLADDLPEVASLLLNPVNAHPGGVEVLGAEIVLAPAPRRIDPGRRSLT